MTVSKFEASQKEFLEGRRQQIFNVVASFNILADLDGLIPYSYLRSSVMRNLDQLCGFTPDESDQARDYIFNASDDGTIPLCVRKELAECASKHAVLLRTYANDREDNRQLWGALYDLFEIDSLWESAKEFGAGEGE